MNFLQTLLSENLIAALGWTVIHSLWQGVLIAALLGMVFFFGKRLTSNVKYIVANVALYACLFVPIATFFMVYEPNGGAMDAGVVDEMIFTLTGEADGSASLLDRYLPIVVNVWLVGFIILLIRMTGGFVYLRKLRSSGQPVDHPIVRRIFKDLLRQTGLPGKIQLLVSSKVSMPSVIGYIKPVVIIPVGMVNQLSYGETEAILAHELAHIMRHDYLFNLIQSFIEAVLYFNPAVWWISSQIRTVREHCCDDMAIQMTGGDQMGYVKSLVAVQQLHAQTMSPARLAMSFSGNSGHMLDRVRRILKQPQKNVFAMEKLIFSGLLLVLFLSASAFNRTVEIHEDPYKVSLEENATTFYVELDTLPEGRRIVEERITVSDNGKEYKAVYNNGALTSLQVDGANIEPEAFGEYTEVLESLRREIKPVEPMHQEKHLQGGISIFSERGENENGEEEQTFTIKIGDDEEAFQLKSDQLKNGNSRVYFFSGENGESNVFEIDGEHEIRLESDGLIWHDGHIKIIGGDDNIIEVEIPEINLNATELPEEYIRFLDGNNNQVYRFKYDHADGMDQNFEFEFNGEEIKRALEDAHRQMEEMQFQYSDQLSQEEMKRAMEKMDKAMLKLNEDMKVEMEERKIEMKERHQEMREAHEERAREQQIRMRQRTREIERDHERRREEMEERRELHERERERMLELAEVYADERVQVYTDGSGIAIAAPRSGRDFNSLVEKEMLKDGLITEPGDYTLKLQEGKMKVNGKRQPQEVYEKYKDMWERHSGTDIDQSKLSINKKN